MSIRQEATQYSVALGQIAAKQMLQLGERMGTVSAYQVLAFTSQGIHFLMQDRYVTGSGMLMSANNELITWSPLYAESMVAKRALSLAVVLFPLVQTHNRNSAPDIPLSSTLLDIEHFVKENK